MRARQRLARLRKDLRRHDRARADARHDEALGLLRGHEAELAVVPVRHSAGLDDDGDGVGEDVCGGPGVVFWRRAGLWPVGRVGFVFVRRRLVFGRGAVLAHRVVAVQDREADAHRAPPDVLALVVHVGDDVAHEVELRQAHRAERHARHDLDGVERHEPVLAHAQLQRVPEQHDGDVVQRVARALGRPDERAERRRHRRAREEELLHALERRGHRADS